MGTQSEVKGTHYSDKGHVRAEAARNTGSPRHQNNTEQSTNKKGLIQTLLEKCEIAQRSKAVPELTRREIQSPASPGKDFTLSH